jgi:hypothetical protein
MRRYRKGVHSFDVRVPRADKLTDVMGAEFGDRCKWLIFILPGFVYDNAFFKEGTRGNPVALSGRYAASSMS